MFAIQGFGQNNCEIKNHYEDFISIKKSSFDDNHYIVKQVIETNNKSCFSDLVNHNLSFMDYLLTNFSSNENYQNLLQISDSITLRKTYLNDLKQDTLFNSVMLDLVNKSINKNITKDSLSMDKILNIAVKYFSILRITNEGNYVGKVCVGLNDIKATEIERNPFIEAFCFASIVENYENEEFSMYDEFVKAIKELYKVNLGIDNNEKRLRAQGAMYMLMRNSEKLQQMLKVEYERQKDYLPFVLIY